MNHLRAVFWDYPEFTDPDTIRRHLEGRGNKRVRRWLLHRFLEHGRVIDTLSFFSLKFIEEEFSNLSLQPYTRKKWRRMLEVYAPSSRK